VRCSICDHLLPAHHQLRRERGQDQFVFVCSTCQSAVDSVLFPDRYLAAETPDIRSIKKYVSD